MNSQYGFLGAEFGYLPCKAAAAAVTATGRDMILATKGFVEREYGCRVIYGVSSPTTSMPESRKNEGENDDDDSQDTDSVFLTLPDPDLPLPEVFRLGSEIAARATDLFPNPVVLEYEKIYHPLLLFGKKHYAGKKFEKVTDPGSLDVKGLACVRKDICPFLRDSCMAVIHLLLDSQHQQGLDRAREAATALLSFSVPTAELILSRQLAASYAAESHPQVQVAALMERRNPGSGPKPGDRVEFVYVERGDKNAKMFERAEDPAYVGAPPVDVLLYFERQLVTQLGDLFKHILSGDPFDTPAINTLLHGLRTSKHNRERDFDLASRRQKPISAFFKQR